MNARPQDDAWDEDEEEGPDGDDDFDYDEFVENEFGGGNQRSQFSPLVRVVAIILLLTLILITFSQLRF